jgi:hypothetical protein
MAGEGSDSRPTAARAGRKNQGWVAQADGVVGGGASAWSRRKGASPRFDSTQSTSDLRYLLSIPGPSVMAEEARNGKWACRITTHDLRKLCPLLPVLTVDWKPLWGYLPISLGYTFYQTSLTLSPSLTKSVLPSLSFVLFCCVCGTGAWYQDLHLSHSTSPTFSRRVFPDRVSGTVCLGWLRTAILLISGSSVSRITSLSLGARLLSYSLNLNFRPSSPRTKLPLHLHHLCQKKKKNLLMPAFLFLGPQALTDIVLPYRAFSNSTDTTSPHKSFFPFFLFFGHNFC